MRTIKSINGKFGFDPVSGIPVFNDETFRNNLLESLQISSGNPVLFTDGVLEICWRGNGDNDAIGILLSKKQLFNFVSMEAEVRVVFRQSRDLPQIAEIGIYKASEGKVLIKYLNHEIEDDYSMCLFLVFLIGCLSEKECDYSRENTG